MSLLFIILAGVAIAVVGYVVKKRIDALDADCEADEFIKKAESLKEEATKKAKFAQSDCKLAFARFGEKKLRVLNHSVSNFLNHFHRLKRSRITIEGINMQDIQRQVSDARKINNQLDTNLKALSAPKMEKKREDAKAYLSQVEVAVKKADAMIDNLQAVRKMTDLFTRQITKCDALFFSLSQGAIATIKKYHYDTSLYSQEEKDQLCVTVSTLSTLIAFLKVSIMDEHQKLNEKAQKAFILMRDQVNALESAQKSGHYNVAMIQSNQKGLEKL
ncbi:sortase [Helicobacter pylori]|uniref:sortase n=1 Tax=Helicobacter pylori TaxID=210 RepID=UPI000D3D81DA|nr:sortase [Helicobacter pylori]PUB93573.1 sortase [Helicobacter pylori]